MEITTSENIVNLRLLIERLDLETIDYKSTVDKITTLLDQCSGEFKNERAEFVFYKNTCNRVKDIIKSIKKKELCQ